MERPCLCSRCKRPPLILPNLFTTLATIIAVVPILMGMIAAFLAMGAGA